MIRFHTNGLSMSVLTSRRRVTFPSNRRRSSTTSMTLYPAAEVVLAPVLADDTMPVIAQTRDGINRPAHLTSPAQVQEKVDEAEDEDSGEQGADDDEVDGHRREFSPDVRIFIRRLFSNERSIIASLQ